jgi:hypothetical protein
MPAGSTYSTIATTTLSSAEATVTFSSISGIYTDLILVIQGRFDSAATIRDLGLRFNGDSGTNYSATRVVGDGSSSSSWRETNFDNMRLAVLPAANSTAGNVGNAVIQIQNYSNTTTNKTVIGRTNDALGWTAAIVGLWRNTSAINSIRIAISETQTGNWIAGSTFTLYGIAAA